MKVISTEGRNLDLITNQISHSRKEMPMAEDSSEMIFVLYIHQDFQ